MIPKDQFEEGLQAIDDPSALHEFNMDILHTPGVAWMKSNSLEELMKRDNPGDDL